MNISPVKIKICGLKSPEALDTCIACGADMAGFVFFAKSPRHLDWAIARTLGAQAAGKIQKVALIVDATDGDIFAIVEALNPDVLQLHGDETPARVTQIRAKFHLPIIKAFGIQNAQDIARMQAQSGPPDRVLLDAKPYGGAELPGGNGLPFDWKLLAGMALSKPWLLSGGLNADNVGAAIVLTHAPGVDVSSGVERAPGIKDCARIAAFIAAARKKAPNS